MRRGEGHLPGFIGIEVITVEPGKVSLRLPLRPEHLAPNGFLHGATVVALADTACGYGAIAHLPEGAVNFTTVELKTNYFGTAREGTVVCDATPAHLGRSTQVWDAEVRNEADGKRLALFRCTQMILWPRS
jgi:uncharacterized protein (TIGR00369 family)